MNYAERFEIGETAAEKGAAIFNAKYTDRKLIKSNKSIDTGGSDYILHMYDKKYHVDFKNNYDSYIYQYNKSGKQASAANPYRKNCLTDYIFVYSKLKPADVYERTMEEYWLTYFKDLESAKIACELARTHDRKMSQEEYQAYANKLADDLTFLIKDTMVVNQFAHPCGDLKVSIKKINPWKHLLKKQN